MEFSVGAGKNDAKDGVFYPVVRQSKYISPTMSNFYGTYTEVLAGFRPVGNTEKNGPSMSNF